MDSSSQYECEVCDFWLVLHGNPTELAYDKWTKERRMKCQGCNKPKRLEAYKSFWAERGEK
jgi:hypothetical protein